MSFLRSQWFVDHSPILSTILLEAANVQQMIRMLTERTAEGQSLLAWVSVNLALWLWYNFYRVATPDRKWAIRCQALGLAMNTAVIATVVWFRFFV